MLSAQRGIRGSVAMWKPLCLPSPFGLQMASGQSIYAQRWRGPPRFHRAVLSAPPTSSVMSDLAPPPVQILPISCSIALKCSHLQWLTSSGSLEFLFELNVCEGVVNQILAGSAAGIFAETWRSSCMGVLNREGFLSSTVDQGCRDASYLHGEDQTTGPGCLPMSTMRVSRCYKLSTRNIHVKVLWKYVESSYDNATIQRKALP